MGAPGVRPAASDYERRLDEAIQYFMFADRFGWPKAVVDEEPAWLIDCYPVIIGAIADVQNRRGGGSG